MNTLISIVVFAVCFWLAYVSVGHFQSRKRQAAVKDEAVLCDGGEGQSSVSDDEDDGFTTFTVEVV